MKFKTFLPLTAVLMGFFVMGFCDIVGISAEYAREAFGWSHTMAGFVPSMVFVWFLFLGVPVGIKMNSWGRKNTVLLSMVITIVGMMIPLLKTSWACLAGYALLGIGNAILQVSLNPLLNNVITNEKLLTSSLTAGQVVKAISSFCGPLIMLFAVNTLGGGDTNNWYLAFPVMGAITLLSMLLLIISPIKREEATDTKVSVAETFALLKNPGILICFFGIFFAVAIDVGTNFTSSKVMVERFAMDVKETGIAPQTYFICRTVGAFLGMFIMAKMNEVKYFRLNIVACIVVILLLAFVPMSEIATLALIGAIGFLCSCVFPIVYAVALRYAPDKANLISGLMITAVAGGGAATPVIGWAVDTFGNVAAGVCVLLACAAYLAFCAFKSSTVSVEEVEN